jgi:hypothetical protein
VQELGKPLVETEVCLRKRYDEPLNNDLLVAIDLDLGNDLHWGTAAVLKTLPK